MDKVKAHTVIVSFYVYKFFSLTIPSEALGRFTDVLSKLIQVESRLNAWQSLPLVYSCLIYVVISIRKNDGIVM